MGWPRPAYVFYPKMNPCGCRFHRGDVVHHTESWFLGNASAPSIPYAFNEDGWLVRVESVSHASRMHLIGGRPLSGRWAEGGEVVIIADVLRGVLRFDPVAGSLEILATIACDGTRIAYADDVRVLRDGRILISDGSRHAPFVHSDTQGQFSTNQNVPVKLELLQGTSSGRFLVLDPLGQRTAAGRIRYSSCARVVSSHHRFANGIALAPADEDTAPGVPISQWAWPAEDASASTAGSRAVHALVVGSGDAEVSRVTLSPGTGEATVKRGWASLEGIGDNISPGLPGTWLVALPAERSITFALLSRSWALRWLALRLPWVLWPPTPSFGSFAVLDGRGRVRERYVDASGEGVSYVNSVAAVECSEVQEEEGFSAELCRRERGAWPTAHDAGTERRGDLPAALLLLGSLHGTGLPVVPLFAHTARASESISTDDGRYGAEL